MPPDKFSTIAFRPVAKDDLEFLLEVYIGTRWEELAPVPWTDTEKRSFLQMQFQLQTQDWNRNYAAAQRDIVLVDDVPAGRLYVLRDEPRRELLVVDIALLPGFRNHGFGTRILQSLFAETDGRGWNVSIHVEKTNPALHLYTRLGFAPVKDGDVYLLMTRSPRATAMA